MYGWPLFIKSLFIWPLTSDGSLSKKINIGLELLVKGESMGDYLNFVRQNKTVEVLQGALWGTSKVFNHKNHYIPMCYTQFL